MPDYYSILEIKSDAGDEEIKKAFRKMALQYHPDRNPEDSLAEEKFKRIAEAYGVLIDPIKRKEYDALRTAPGKNGSNDSFHYTQEEILRDLFNNSQASAVFAELLKEFGKAGLRYGPKFFSRSLLGGRGFFLGGIILFGLPGLLRTLQQLSFKGPGSRKGLSLLESLRMILGSFLNKANPSKSAGSTRAPQKNETDNSDITITYDLNLRKDEIRKRKWVHIALDRGEGMEKIRITLPSDLKPGTTLRLKGKGVKKGDRKGDLLVVIHF